MKLYKKYTKIYRHIQQHLQKYTKHLGNDTKTDMKYM